MAWTTHKAAIFHLEITWLKHNAAISHRRSRNIWALCRSINVEWTTGWHSQRASSHLAARFHLCWTWPRLTTQQHSRPSLDLQESSPLSRPFLKALKSHWALRQLLPTHKRRRPLKSCYTPPLLRRRNVSNHPLESSNFLDSTNPTANNHPCRDQPWSKWPTVQLMNSDIDTHMVCLRVSCWS